MNSSHTSNRVVIVGGGVAGLSSAVRLAQSGLAVTVLEASQLGIGASTRNQGWLNSGAWYAPENVELARMCYGSLQQTLRFCPECVEPDPAPMVYLASRGETDLDRWIGAWEAAGIPYSRLSDEAISERFPGLAISHARHAFELPDRSMRIDLLLSRLADAARDAGAEIRSGTPVARLGQGNDGVQGIETESGERISARLVILAGNAKGGALFPGFGAGAVGESADQALVVLKTHLVAVRPQLSPWPLCVVDAGGFNHVPHHPISVLGANRWLPARHGEDQEIIAAEIEQIWEHAERLFPDFKRQDHEITQWAGTAVHPLALDQIESGPVPLPMVIDHQREEEPVENLISIFPGRATLWPHLAEKTSQLVLAKLQQRQCDVAQPPWGVEGSIGSEGRIGSGRIRSVLDV